MSYISDDSSANLGSYVKIDVPSHGTSSFYYRQNESPSTVTMGSFLRIGAVPSDDPTAEDGWDLAQLVVGFMDDTRERVTDLGETGSNKLWDVLEQTIENATTEGSATTTTEQTYLAGETPPTEGATTTTDANGVSTVTTVTNVLNADGTTTSTSVAVSSYGSDTMTISDDMKLLMASFYSHKVDSKLKSGSYSTTAEKTAAAETAAASTLLTADQKKRVIDSMKLHYRGGWRDHTDGNRVVTTRGDKVEVIRGNYKMVVLGRQTSLTTPVDTIDNSTTTWDASGGHILDWRQTPGATTEVSWVKSPYSMTAALPGKNEVESPGVSGDDDSGSQYYTWRVKETTVKGDVESTTYGKVSEWFLGPSTYSQQGWEDAPATDGSYDGTTGKTRSKDASDSNVPELLQAYPNLNRENPTITEKTWAKSISEYTGSSACPVKTITEKTHAKDITSTTDVSESITSTVKAAGLTEILHIDKVERHIGKSGTPAHVGESWHGNFGELFFGGYESLKVGLFLEGRIAGKILETNASLLGKNTITITATHIINWDWTLLKIDNLGAFRKSDYLYCEENLELCTAPKQVVHLSRVAAALMCFLG